jgi:hypothetical protein
MQVLTNCKGCLFATYTENTQTGCELNRAEKLNPKNDLLVDTDDDTYHYTFSRFCNTYRPEEWLLVLDEEEKSDLHTTVMRETCPRLGFFLFLEEDYLNLDGLIKTLDGIENQDFGRARYVVVINPKVEHNEDIHDLLRSKFDFDETEFHIVQTLVKDKNIFLLDDAFRHAKNGWAYVTNCGEEIRTDLLQKMHDRINIDMRRLVLVKPYDDFNGMIFQTAMYKFLDGNRKLVNSETGEEIVMTFLDKLEGMVMEDPDSITSWEDFVNESA